MRTFFFAILLSCAGHCLLGQGADVLKPGAGDIVKLNFYADNWCMVFINGKLVAVNSIDFLPHNEVSVNVLPDYPMTIAVLAKDNADPEKGLEYGNHIGDGGFILKMGDGTASNGTWKTKVFFKGPLNGDLSNPTVQYTPIPANWFSPAFDDSSWDNATVVSTADVKPDGTYVSADFTGASFIWSGNLLLDNTIILRTTVQAPKGYVKKWNTVPDLDIKNVFSEAQLTTVATPNLFVNNSDNLAMGYVTRIHDGQTTTEQIAQINEGVVTALPIDLGPENDQVFLTLLGSNFGNTTSGIAMIGGTSTALAYAGPQGGPAGLSQFVMPLPRSLSGQGRVAVSVASGGKTSNIVNVSIQ